MTTDGLIGQEIYSRAEVCVKRLHACDNRLVWTLWALQNAAEISQRDNPASNKKAARCTYECKPRRLVVVSPQQNFISSSLLPWAMVAVQLPARYGLLLRRPQPRWPGQGRRVCGRRNWQPQLRQSARWQRLERRARLQHP